MKELCFDISTWQGGINYQAIRERVKYCILRAGFSETKDNRFEEHYANLQGLNLGAYWYSYATNENEARREAKKCIEVINGKEFTLPIYLDIEDPSMSGLGRGALDAIVRAFGDEIEKAGYYFGVYSNLNWYRNIISGSELNKRYDWWIASFGSNDGNPHSQPKGIDYGIWQYTSKYNTFGWDLDANFVYKDYPKIIRELGLNHLTPIEPSNIEYNAHVEEIGWQGWKNCGEVAGTTGESKRLEALKIKSDKYDIYASAHIQDIGWVDYGKVDENTIIGTTGEAKKLECLKLKIVEKGTDNIKCKFRVHIEDYGWTPFTNADGICTLGTVGQFLRIEAIEIKEI